ncbi:MAG: secretin N-terminal domain-containing protein, partial [Dehalococcoidales bacterium]
PVKPPTGPTSARRPTARTPTRPTVRTPPIPKAKAAADKGVYLDTDDRTNSVLMIGLEEDLETVDMLIDSLDVAKYGLKSVKEYAMQFVEATEIVNTLAELGVITSVPGSARTSRTGLPTTLRAPTSRGTTARAPAPRPPTSSGARSTQGEPQISVRLTTNSLLVNATPEQHAEIEMMIRFVDVEQKDIRTVQEYEIQYVDITEVVDTLTELGIVEQRASSASSRRAGGFSPPSSMRATGARPSATTGPATPQAPSTLTFEATTGAEITSEQPQIAILESTNSLLVYATPKQHDTISLIVAHVDRELPDISTPYVVYALENQDPVELADTLNEIIQATVKEAAKSPTSKVQTAATAMIPPKREKNEIQIVADVKSYSLIVYADKKNQQWISALIQELDAYRPQVHLDVTLVAITQDDQFNYDLDLVTKLPQFTIGGSMESGGLVKALVDPFPGSVFEASVSDGSGIAFYSDDHIQTLLELLDKKNYGRVLARPSLLVKDNQLGEIKAEKTIYVAQEKSSIVPTTATTQQTVTDVTFEAYTSGVTLSITPHIASDKILQLEIMLDRTDFVPDTGSTVIRGETFPKPLDTNASNLATWAVLPNGATIILGGIESITQSKTIRKVPLLGDLPIIGALFRGVDETDVQSKLYVFVKATIIRPGEELTGVSDIEVISRKKREAFEEDEVKFQKLEGVIPGVTPPPLDPIKILEDDEYIRELKKKLHKDEKVSVEVKLDDAY